MDDPTSKLRGDTIGSLSWDSCAARHMRLERTKDQQSRAQSRLARQTLAPQCRAETSRVRLDESPPLFQDALGSRRPERLAQFDLGPATYPHFRDHIDS